MKTYVRPTAELILFDDNSKVYMASSCNCYYDTLNTETLNPCAQIGWYAYENPFGVAAPNIEFSSFECAPKTRF